MDNAVWDIPLFDDQWLFEDGLTFFAASALAFIVSLRILKNVSFRASASAITVSKERAKIGVEISDPSGAGVSDSR